MRKALLIVGLVSVAALVFGFLVPRLMTRPSREPGPAVLGEAASHDEQSLITARGVVVPVRWARLSFAVGGQLAEIAATPGMTLTEGQILATLDRQELRLQLDLAENELAAEQARLAQLQEAASEAEIAAARASYEAALAAYEELKAGPNAAQIALAEADLHTAETALQRAQAAYDAVRSLPDIGARPESVQLQQATIDYQRAKAAYELAVSGPSQAELKQAESLVASAKAQLETLNSTRPSEIQAAEASVAQARIRLEEAQLRFDQATLYAPKAPDGLTVTSVADLQPGDTVSPGMPVVTVADLSELQVEVTDLDEWGAANVTPDQTADLLVAALDNRNLRGHVISVASEPTVHASGAIFYKAIIALDRQEPALRWGNSVRVRLYVAGAKGVGFR